MKNIIAIIFILISAKSFSQVNEHYRDSIFSLAQNCIKENKIEKAYDLFSYGSSFFSKNQFEKAKTKTDSLRPILRQKLLKEIIGKWNLTSSHYKTKIQSIEIFNDRILFIEENDIRRTEKIIFENDPKFIKKYFEVIFSDNSKWFLSLENEYLTLAFVSEKIDDGELTYSDNNDEYVFKK